MKDYYLHDYSSFPQYYDPEELEDVDYIEGFRQEEYEEEEGYFSGMEIYQKNVTEIMNIIDTRFANLYGELMFHGMSQGGIRELFRYIVYFTINNEGRYPGNEMQKAYAVFYALRSLQPWVFSSFASTYLPAYRIDYIIMTIIMFTLRMISSPAAQ
jgi:hypothetical protein